MSPDEALAAALKQSLRSVVIIAEPVAGGLNLIIGPDSMSLAQVNFLLDQVKQYMIGQTLVGGQTLAPAVNQLQAPMADPSRDPPWDGNPGIDADDE